MYGYEIKIKEFIKNNFEPSTPENANMKMKTSQLLFFLWNTFPVDCISDYELVLILEELGYKETMYVVENSTKRKAENRKYIEIQKGLELGWCLKSPFDLRTETIEDLSEEEE
ncbi:hypothetical protein [Paenimyroides baculatum]|uniref:Uncharacterized protein n=1 Tax=Paenimyroides baculatum TaxID=2608000 RepID=A0A5M6CI81_9FLAO|nr:hypothetical protein [Paenimyroides baculatum]KAA5532799.1 hypothetical protein F0460_13215 [Paenimyroides baculatum]